MSVATLEPSAPETPEKRQPATSAWTPEIIKGAFVGSFTKLDPRLQARNPVMFVVEVGAVITTAVFIKGLIAGGVAKSASRLPRASEQGES